MFTSVVAFLLGVLVGSFLNVCIYRLPRKESVIFPASACPICRISVRPFDNIPLLSYVVLRGRCRSCRGRISIRYPIIEATNGLAYVLVVWQFGLGWSAVVYGLLFSALLVVSCIDLSHQIIPDRITLPGIPLGLLCAATVLPVGLLNSVLGLLLGGGVLWGLAWVSPYLFGKEGMGGGDIKLLAMIGAFLGWKSTLLTMLIGAMAGSTVGLGLIAMKVIKRDDYLPFGPFLAVGAVISMFFHQAILQWYSDLLAGLK